MRSRKLPICAVMFGTFLLQLGAVAAPARTRSQGKSSGALNSSTRVAQQFDWSKAMVESTMKRFPTAQDLGSWGYAKSLYLYGQYLVWRRTGDERYLRYIKEWVDSHVDNEGNVFNTDKGWQDHANRFHQPR